MTNRTQRAAALVLAGGLVVLAACHREPPRMGVTGSVTFDGQPVPSGSISFSLPDGASPSTGTMIVDGKFALLPADGLLPGRYAVRIRSEPRGRVDLGFGTPISHADEGAAAPLPDPYDQGSVLTIELRPGGPTHFDFELTSRD